MKYKQAVFIHGAPRSGTSWLGQILNAHASVAYRYQPLFSYKFKDRVKPDSTRSEIYDFLDALYNEAADEFVLQSRQQEQGIYPRFEKSEAQDFLVIKMVRYHHLIEKFLREIDGVKIVGIVRHPCGAISSWLKTPREFKPEWDPLAEWRKAPSKNQGRPEEYFGFERWKELAGLFLDLEKGHPDQFYLVKYETLVEATAVETEKLFSFVGLGMTESVESFIAGSHSKEIEDPYAVFKKKDVKDRWVTELDPVIRDAIIEEIQDSRLSVFL